MNNDSLKDKNKNANAVLGRKSKKNNADKPILKPIILENLTVLYTEDVEDDNTVKQNHDEFEGKSLEPIILDNLTVTYTEEISQNDEMLEQEHKDDKKTLTTDDVDELKDEENEKVVSDKPKSSKSSKKKSKKHKSKKSKQHVTTKNKSEKKDDKPVVSKESVVVDKDDNKMNKMITFIKQNFRYLYTLYAILAIILVSIIIYVVPESISVEQNVKPSARLVSDDADKQNVPEVLTPEQQELKDTIIAGVGDCSTICVKGYEILANGIRVAFVQDKKTANDILENLKDKYIKIQEDARDNEEETIEVVECYFEQDVEIKKSYLSVVKALPIEESDEQLQRIIKGNKQLKRHVIEKGENFWLIAQGYGIPVETLINANPDLNPKTLQIGQVISLSVPRPLISVYTVIKQEYEDFVPFDVVYEDTKDMYQGEYRTKVSGVRGKKFVSANVYSLDGLEAGRIVLKEEITQDPVTQIVLRGTAPPPPKKGTGTFSRPVRGGYVTSGFGWRWGRKHQGIDIGVPTGTPVKAADGGVVVFSGTKGGYGKCVIIDHGANLKTLYAHNSKLHVRKGDKVFKGQVIADSGNTGRSTGPHLHFEIRKNNVPVNPTKYLSF